MAEQLPSSSIDSPMPDPMAAGRDAFEAGVNDAMGRLGFEASVAALTAEATSADAIEQGELPPEGVEAELGHTALLEDTAEDAAAQTENPYERLTDEQLLQVQDSVADSFTAGVKGFDLEATTQSGTNLAAIRRELERRDPEQYPPRQRGIEGNTITETRLSPEVIEKIVEDLQGTDGSLSVLNSMRRLMTPKIEEGQETATDEAILQTVEVLATVYSVEKELAARGESVVPTNPYSVRTNEQLAETVAQFKSTIEAYEQAGQPQKASELRKKLAQVGQVIMQRRAA